MNGKIRSALILIMLVSLVTISCEKKKSNKHGITYNEISQEQSAADLTDAFANSGEKIEVEPEIDDFFTRLGKATISPSPINMDEFISGKAMIETAEAAGALHGLKPAERRGFERGFLGAMSKAGDNFRRMAYDRHRIVRVEKPAENRRIVFTTLYSNELNITHKMRWWMIKTESGWRIHDYEDLSVGLRSVGLIATLMNAGLGKSQEPWVSDFMIAIKAMQKIDLTNIEELAKLRDPMKNLLKHSLPSDVKRFGSAMLVSALMAGGELDEADKEIAAAETGGYASPLLHYQKGHVLMAREEWRLALGEFAKHIALMGSDSDILESVSECHYSLDEMALAKDAALKGLDDNPQSVSCLAWLVVTGTVDEMSDPGLAAKFHATGNAASAYEMTLDLLIFLEEIEKTKALFAITRSKLGNQELIDYYEETIAEMEKK